MKKSILTVLMKKLQIVPSKKMGQNFLVDENFLDFLAREAAISEGEKILEIGPGFGALTERMLDAKAELVAIEFDRKLAQWLRDTLAPRGLTLIEGDACKVNIPEIFGENTDFRLISNLPYSAGTVIVANMLDLTLPPKEMIIMLQKEVAERFAANAGTSEYSALSVRIQSVYEVHTIKIIPPELFYPQPEIESAVIRLTRRETLLPREARLQLSRLVRTAFAQRRKKMFKQVASIFGKEETCAAMASAGIDPDIRAERVTLQQFQAMSAFLSREKTNEIPAAQTAPEGNEA